MVTQECAMVVCAPPHLAQGTDAWEKPDSLPQGSGLIKMFEHYPYAESFLLSSA